MAGTILFLLLVVSCNAAAHLKSLQAPLPRRSTALIRPFVAVPRPSFQRGVDVDAYTYSGQDISLAAAAVVAYARKLNANSISISVPYFMSGPSSLRVFATSRTPSPSQLSVLVQYAENAGMYVSIRPLLDEYSLGKSRVTWRPVNLAAWFENYWLFLEPYLRMAQLDKVPEFIVGAEFSRFGRSPLWNGLDRKILTVFHGTLAYSNNDTTGLSAASGGLLAVKAVDIYHPIAPPFLRGWRAFDRHLPKGAVATEVGIAAVDGAWAQPWVHRWRVTSLNPMVQARWFTAACQAAIATGLQGIYFWSLPLGARFPGPTLADQGNWGDSAGAAAIARCFRGQSG